MFVRVRVCVRLCVRVQATLGMQRGPAPADFDAAMLAQQAPSKNPPRRIGTDNVTSVSW